MGAKLEYLRYEGFCTHGEPVDECWMCAKEQVAFYEEVFLPCFDTEEVGLRLHKMQENRQKKFEEKGVRFAEQERKKILEQERKTRLERENLAKLKERERKKRRVAREVFELLRQDSLRQKREGRKKQLDALLRILQKKRKKVAQIKTTKKKRKKK